MTDPQATTTSGSSRVARWLAILALFAAASIVTVHTPAMIYAGSSSDFALPLADLMLGGLSVAAILLALLLAPLLLLQGKPLLAYACASFAIAVYGWVSINLMVIDFGLLDGQLTTIPIAWTDHLMGWLGFLFVPAAAAVFAWKQTTWALRVVAILNVALWGGTASYLLADSKPLNSEAPKAETEIFHQYSTDRNVVVLLFDGFQSDVFLDVLNSDAALRQGFPGFTLYRDTLGLAPTTYMSMPGIHSGRSYQPGDSIFELYEKGIRTDSFMSSLARAGYQGSLLHPIKNTCPEGLELCVEPSRIIEAGRHLLVDQLAYLIDVSLLRAAPAFLKNCVFNGGRLTVSPLVASKEAPNVVAEGNRIIEIMGESSNLDATAPTAKFIHLMHTHPPMLVDENCAPYEKPLPMNASTVRKQYLCAVRVLARSLQKLQENGIYDNTLIALIGDHGSGRESLYGSPEEGAGWSWLAGTANPVLALKPRGERGEFQVSDRPAQLTDLAATICDELDACQGFPGSSLLGPPPPKSSTRLFSHYIWKNSWWGLDSIPELTRHFLDGPVWKWSSWKRETANPYTFGEEIDFTNRGDSMKYGLKGWYYPEGKGRWTAGRTALVEFSVSPKPRQPMLLEAKAQSVVGVNHPRLEVEVTLDGRPLGTWSFEHPGSSEGVRQVIIPTGAWPRDGRVELAFHIREPLRVQTLPWAARSLGLLFQSIRIVPAPL